jgi:hypothetical protein
MSKYIGRLVMLPEKFWRNVEGATDIGIITGYDKASKKYEINWFISYDGCDPMEYVYEAKANIRRLLF